MALNGQVIFVVTRESIEALLVIGILWAWMTRNGGAKTGKIFLSAGIIAGLALACLLALALIGVTTFLSGTVQQWFEIAILVFASILIVQMVMWMRKHGRTLKSELETGLQQSVATQNWWGVFFLAMIAVGREGSETVVFLYSSFLALSTFMTYVNFFLSAGIGLALALLFFYLLQLGNKFISWRIFFKVTEILLLFLGSALFLTAMEKLLNGPLGAVNLPMWIYRPVWDTSSILDDSSILGNLCSSIFGYRSIPNVWDLIVYAVYWITVISLIVIPAKRAKNKAVVNA